MTDDVITVTMVPRAELLDLFCLFSKTHFEPSFKLELKFGKNFGKCKNLKFRKLSKIKGKKYPKFQLVNRSI